MAKGQHGGRRPGAGRPKGSRNKDTLARERAIADRQADAVAALDVLIAIAKNDAEDPRVRRLCARDVLDRLWGRPRVQPPPTPPQETLDDETTSARDLIARGLNRIAATRDAQNPTE